MRSPRSSGSSPPRRASRRTPASGKPPTAPIRPAVRSSRRCASGTRRSRPSSSSSTSSGAGSTTTSPSGCSPIQRSKGTPPSSARTAATSRTSSRSPRRGSRPRRASPARAPGAASSTSSSPSSASPSTASELSLDEALSRLSRLTDQGERGRVAEAVTQALRPGLRTRGYVLNTILNERAIEDRLRGYDSWISAQNLSNEIPDEATQSLVDAIMARYDIPRRFYALKARLLGLPRLRDYDRFAPLQEVGGTIAWARRAGARPRSVHGLLAGGGRDHRRLLREGVDRCRGAAGEDARRLLRDARSRTATRTC